MCMCVCIYIYMYVCVYLKYKFNWVPCISIYQIWELQQFAPLLIWSQWKLLPWNPLWSQDTIFLFPPLWPFFLLSPWAFFCFNLGHKCWCFEGYVLSTFLVLHELIYSGGFISFTLTPKYLLLIPSCLSNTKLARLTINWTSPLAYLPQILTSTRLKPH